MMTDVDMLAHFHMARYGYNAVPWGLCALVARDIVADLPDAEMVGGHVFLKDGGQFQHWWVERDGEIIDPMTATAYADGTPKWVADPEADAAFSIEQATHKLESGYESDDAAPCDCGECLGESR